MIEMMVECGLIQIGVCDPENEYLPKEIECITGTADLVSPCFQILWTGTQVDYVNLS